MFRRAKKFYSEELKNRALAAYQNSNESVSEVAARFGINFNTFNSWVHRKVRSKISKKRANLADLKLPMNLSKEITPESTDSMKERIDLLERQLIIETMRSESLSKMIEIAERELKICIRKKTGAKQSMR